MSSIFVVTQAGISRKALSHGKMKTSIDVWIEASLFIDVWSLPLKHFIGALLLGIYCTNRTKKQPLNSPSS